jgi:glucose-6-phosphate 1-dehydrogenase
MTMNDAARRPENHVIVLFGATGDLARRKLLPGLFHLHAAGLLPREYRVIGSAPASFALTGRQFRAHFPDAVRRFNEIVIDFADPGSISAEFLVKVPGAEMHLGGTKMTFSYKNSFAMSHALEGYERLILLAMTGDQSLFTRSDGIERLWEISAPLLDKPPPVEPYEPGSWGPPSVDRLIAPFLWHLPES